MTFKKIASFGLLFSTCSPAFALTQVQITDDKIISLMDIAPERIDYDKFVKKGDDWDWNSGWEEWYCMWFGLCPDPDPAPPPDTSGEKDYRAGIKPLAHDIGMQGVLVLDQGQYGTCVTFSSTAALNALLNKGDYISQQCSLAYNLGQGNNYWDGAYRPDEILNPILQVGVVSKAKCPKQYADRNHKLTVSEYKALADSPVPVFKLSYKSSGDLNAVKQAIDRGNRVLIGFLLDGNSSEAVRGYNVKVNGVSYTGGLWACKQGSSADHCVASNAGHEVVIVGYDNDQRLLKIRNSWGSSVGEYGEYYMSFEFFNKMVIDQTEISQ